MRRLQNLFLLVCLLVVPASALAQGGFTTVSGTIKDPNGVAYACGTISAQLITAGGAAPTLNGGGFTTQTSPVQLGCPTVPGSGASGSFTMRLADSGVISPANTTWKFTVNTTGNAPPLGTGPQTFSFTSAINCSTNTPSTCTSNAMDISASLNALAPALGSASSSLATSLRPATVSDNFVRANANPVGGNWSTATSAPCGMQISSNTLIASSSSSICLVNWTLTTFPTSQFVEASLSAKVASTTFYLGVKTDGGNFQNGYYVLLNGALGATIAQVFKRVAGVNTNLGSAVVLNSNANDVIRLSVQIDVISLLVNGVPKRVLVDQGFVGITGTAQIGISDSASTADVAVNYWAGGLEGDYRSLQSIFFGGDIVLTTTNGAMQKNTLQGSALICPIESNQTNSSVSVNDTQGNKFTIVGGSGFSLGTGALGWVAYALGIAGGADTITVNFPGAGQHIVVVCTEYFDLGAFDAVFITTATSSAPTATFVTRGFNELMVGTFAVTSNFQTAGINGATLRFESNALNADEVKIFDATAQYAGLNSIVGAIGDVNGGANSQIWGAMVAVFSGSSGPLSTSLNAPTISSGFGTSPSIASTSIPDGWTIDLNVGAGGVASSGVIGLPAAPNGWNCTATDYTNPTTAGGISVKSSPTSTTSVTITGYNATPTATAWTASDHLAITCSPR